MRKRRTLRAQGLLFRVSLAILASACARSASAAEIGATIDNFQLRDASGVPQSLDSYSGRIVVLFFWSFKCPVSLAYADRLEELEKKYANRGVVVLGVASASNESREEIRANAANLKINVPILMDSDGELMRKLGAAQTPSVFILDKKSVLRYKGAPDNNRPPGDKGRIAFADDAIEDLLGHRAMRFSEVKPFGCNIRQKSFKE